jgi:hypothetical protein
LLYFLAHPAKVGRYEADTGYAMSTCTRCGASFGCAMVDGSDGPCWCTALPPAVPVPDAADATAAGTTAAGCWCPACLRQHIAQLPKASPDTPRS